MDKKYKESLKKFYPTLSDVELEEAGANLDAYLELAWEIFEETTRKEDGKGQEEAGLSEKLIDASL